MSHSIHSSTEEDSFVSAATVGSAGTRPASAASSKLGMVYMNLWAILYTAEAVLFKTLN